jgi:ATP-dependent DNA helicase RecQ
MRTSEPWTYDTEREEAVTALRRAEQEQMRDYARSPRCRSQELRAYLDDADTEPCGLCDRCTGDSLAIELDPARVQTAIEFLRSPIITIEPRKRLPVRGVIKAEQRPETGRALAVWGDGGWGSLVRRGRVETGRFDDQLVDASAVLISERWKPDPAPRWVTFVPSLRRPELVADLAERLAERLGLPCAAVVVKRRETQPQKELENSVQQHANVSGAFTVDGPLPPGPVLLVDDTVDTRWTLSEVAALLRDAGAEAVHPYVLADTVGRSLD